MATWCCTDIHGCIEFYHKIKNFIKPEDTVYFLGDAGDRGPHPWETIKAIATDPQFIYLKGNHEDMLVKASRFYLGKEWSDREDIYLLEINGGASTLDGLLGEENPERWVDYLYFRPTMIKYTNPNGENIYLSHAGFTPHLNNDGNVEDTIFNNYLWNRDHWLEEWDNEIGNAIVVHGHTPIPLLMKDFPEYRNCKDFYPKPLWYEEDHKVCIDCGAVWTGHFILLNLDTWEFHTFKSDSIEEN